MQSKLFQDLEEDSSVNRSIPFKTQLLKWVGNKQRFAHEIISFFPERFNTYYEPFLGSAAVLGTLAPCKGIGGDTLKPLSEIWRSVIENPKDVAEWYENRFDMIGQLGKEKAYEAVKASYNQQPNAADFLFISRTCYGGVLRFRKVDGYISTPCGVHDTVSPESFRRRLGIWHARLKNSVVYHADFEELFRMVKKGDMVYCDPPYSHTQSILYGAQSFSLERLFRAIAQAKEKGAYVALSIDGSKKSGNLICRIDVPKGLFKREVSVNCGRSMLRRFQLKDRTLEDEVVSDRLLLTW